MKRVLDRAPVDRQRVGGMRGRAVLGEPDPAVQAELDLACGGGGLPGEVDVAFGEQRVDELAGVPLAECSQGGVALGRRCQAMSARKPTGRLPLVTRFLPAPLVARRSASMCSEVAPSGAPWSRYPDRGGRAEMDATSNPSWRVESFSAAFLMTSVCRRGHHTRQTSEVAHR
jgi:hypothetical protein